MVTEMMTPQTVILKCIGMMNAVSDYYLYIVYLTYLMTGKGGFRCKVYIQSGINKG